ncbi:MAG: hypothetical protein AABX37_05755, partial [Nanoarchaeota archaeon]
GKYERLYDLMQQGVYHVMDLDLLTEDIPHREGRIVWAAIKGIMGYRESHPEEVKKILACAWEKRLILPYVFTGYFDLDDEQAINIYFELFKMAQGEEDFLINGIMRGFDFNFFGRKLKRKFPDFNFKDCYLDIEDDTLRAKCDTLFM